MKKAKSKMKNYGAAGAAILFFLIYLFLYWPVAGGDQFLIHNQPDEVANYFFIRELAWHGRFSYPEALSQITLNQLHPRSMTVVFGNLVPIGFPGIIVVYGALLKIWVRFFGSQSFNWLAVALTPLVALSAVGFFYAFLKKIFSPQVAAISAGLLLISPQWWYYASRPFQHNTLFVFFFLAFLYFISRCYGGSGMSFLASFARSSGSLTLCSPASPPPGAGAPSPAGCACAKKDSALRRSLGLYISKFLSGLTFGLAVFVRPSELVWLTALLIFLLLLVRKNFGWRQWLALGSGLALAATFFFSAQLAIYGAPWGSGYVKPTASGAAGEITEGPQGLPLLQALFLPFGFKPRHIWQNFKNYFFSLWPWWSAVTLISLALFIRDLFRRRDHLKIIYLTGFLFVAVYLLIFYGSWSFFDNLALLPSLASSQVRYFLPVYVLALPFVALFLVKLWGGNYWHKSAALIVSLILAASSFSAVYLSFDGLLTVKESLAKYAVWQKEIYKIVPENGVVLTRYADKYIWPGRRVIAGWQRPEQLQAAANLLKSGRPVYLYDLTLTPGEEATLSISLTPLGLHLGAPLLRLENLELRPLSP